MVLAMVLTVVLTFSSPWSSPCPRHGPHCPQGILLRGRCSAGRGQGSRESRRVTASLWDSNAAGITRPGAGGWTAERGTSPRTAGQLNAGTGKKHGRAADTHVQEHPGCRDGPGIAAAGLPSLRGAGAEHPSFLPSYLPTHPSYPLGLEKRETPRRRLRSSRHGCARCSRDAACVAEQQRHRFPSRAGNTQSLGDAGS